MDRDHRSSAADRRRAGGRLRLPGGGHQIPAQRPEGHLLRPVHRRIPAVRFHRRVRGRHAQLHRMAVPVPDPVRHHPVPADPAQDPPVQERQRPEGRRVRLRDLRLRHRVPDPVLLLHVLVDARGLPAAVRGIRLLHQQGLQPVHHPGVLQEHPLAARHLSDPRVLLRELRTEPDLQCHWYQHLRHDHHPGFPAHRVGLRGRRCGGHLLRHDHPQDRHQGRHRDRRHPHVPGMDRRGILRELRFCGADPVRMRVLRGLWPYVLSSRFHRARHH